MKYLQLLPCTLRDEIIVQVIFHYDQDLINRMRLIEGAQWSASLKTWYFNRRAFNLNSFFKKFKGIAFVDYSKLNPTPLVSKPNSTIFKAQQPNIQLPSSYQELLELKRYSPNTIKTYVSEFKKFCSFYAAQDINALTQDDIKRYLLSIIQKQKVSASSQNQAINAIKFYYEKVLQLSKMVFTIQRPRKEKLLPKVLSKEEVFAIISSIQNLKHRSIIALIYSAGLRRSELLNLKIQDIDYTPTRQVRYLDRLVDELAKGRKMEKVLRTV